MSTITSSMLLLGNSVCNILIDIIIMYNFLLAIETNNYGQCLLNVHVYFNKIRFTCYSHRVYMLQCMHWATAFSLLYLDIIHIIVVSFCGLVSVIQLVAHKYFICSVYMFILCLALHSRGHRNVFGHFRYLLLLLFIPLIPIHNS